ncbi:MAG TPA: nitrate reductase associated protein [Chitinophagaceae bacterium]|nr:nitrate reductase associated protein [Chitinophagaceae bacterium]
MIWDPGHITYFKFEADFIEDNVRCIPMIVRFKLDGCGIKLKLAEWSRFTAEERNILVNKPCTHPDDITAYGEYLRMLVLHTTGMQAADLPVEELPAWADTDILPIMLLQKANALGERVTIQQWANLTNLQRFALVKLSRQSHESKNLPKALKEFGLL